MQFTGLFFQGPVGLQGSLGFAGAHGNKVDFCVFLN